MLENITWLGHDAFQIAASKMIYVDPFQLAGDLEPADVICITHGHNDHCSPEDVARIRREDTVVVAAVSCRGKVKGDVRFVTAGDKVTIDDLVIEAIPAYNVNKRFHPKEAGGVGYLLSVDGSRIYHAGDTDPIPEMEGLDVDIALLPVSGVYVATAEEAVEAANKIGPKMVIPMHYGSIVGSSADAERFKELWPGQVVILEAQPT
ncbi:MAG: MBL fold metallo-hydrolase [Anaerolineae bacterium]|jgi:L-ascorbate metabolism protein UlaG (beta-lactamase superfamily)